MAGASDKSKDEAKVEAPAVEDGSTQVQSGILKDDAYEPVVIEGQKVGRTMAAPDPREPGKADGQDVKLTSAADAGTVEEYVTLNRDVIEEFYADGALRPSHRILFHKGEVVKKSDLEALEASQG